MKFLDLIKCKFFSILNFKFIVITYKIQYICTKNNMHYSFKICFLCTQKYKYCINNV